MKHTTKVLALTTSSIVTPSKRLGSYVPAFLKNSAAMGTVEFTGLLTKFTIALGQHLAMPSHKVLTIPALTLNKSSLVIPGFNGTLARMMTRSMPVKASSNLSFPRKPRTYNVRHKSQFNKKKQKQLLSGMTGFIHLTKGGLMAKEGKCCYAYKFTINEGQY